MSFLQVAVVGWISLSLLIPVIVAILTNLCGGGSKTVQWTVLGQQLETRTC